MAITAFPFETDDTTEEQFSRLMSEAVDSGIAAGQGSTFFNISPSGMGIVAATGAAVVRGVFGYTTGTEGPVSVSNGHATLTRIDMAVLRLDRANNVMTLAVVQGTASSTPTDPALTQTDTGLYELPLARLTIPAGAGTMLSGYITDLRPFIGTTTQVWSSASRPSAPRKGKLGYNVTTARWEWYDGSAWQAMIPSTIANATTWNGYSVVVSTSQPPATANTIWIQPLS